MDAAHSGGECQTALVCPQAALAGLALAGRFVAKCLLDGARGHAGRLCAAHFTRSFYKVCHYMK